jgi:hypothetical protein
MLSAARVRPAWRIVSGREFPSHAPLLRRRALWGKTAPLAQETLSNCERLGVYSPKSRRDMEYVVLGVGGLLGSA